MKEKLPLIVLIALLTISHCFLIIQNKNLKVSFLELKEETASVMKNFENTLNEHTQEINEQMIAMNSDIQTIYENQNANASDIQITLSSIKRKSEAQFSQTVVMKETYDALLEEQKKKTVDTSEKDNEITKIKLMADKFFDQKDYTAAYEEYIKVLEIRNDDFESRTNKMKSLYYMNPLNTSNYTEIMEDIKILKQNGKCDDDCLEIENIIFAERGGINE